MKICKLKWQKYFFQNISIEKMDSRPLYSLTAKKQAKEKKKQGKKKKHKQGHSMVYPLSILFFFRIFANLFSPRRLLVISSFIAAESILICASAYVREALKRLGETKDIMTHNWILKMKTLFCLAETEVCYQSWFTIIQHSTPKCSKTNGQNKTDLARYLQVFFNTDHRSILYIRGLIFRNTIKSYRGHWI